MTASVRGLRVVLVAAFNRRYHRSAYELAAALGELGCEVTTCEERMRGLNAILRRPLAARLRGAVRRTRPDLVLVFKGDRLEPAAVRELKAEGAARWVNWFPDDPHRLDLSLRLAPAYDAFFTHDSWSLDRHRAAGANAHYLAFGCDSEFLRPVPVAERFRAPVVFVGSRDPARERVLDAVRDAGAGLKVWGPRWPAGAVYGEDLVRALAGGEVGLNVHQHFGEPREPNRYGHGANMRVFELAAVGTPQLCDAKTDIARHLTPDREIALYRSVAELKDRARALLADSGARKAMAGAARERVVREHTWTHRLRELLSITLR